MSAENNLHIELKELIVECLGLEGTTPADIGDDEPLFSGLEGTTQADVDDDEPLSNEGLGLDSVDALELVVGLELKYGISIKSHDIDVNVFSSVSALAAYIQSMQSTTDADSTRSHDSET